jgi:hypothetical protein
LFLAASSAELTTGLVSARLDGLYDRGGGDIAERNGREIAHVVAASERAVSSDVPASAGAMTPSASAASLPAAPFVVDCQAKGCDAMHFCRRQGR